MKFFACFCKQLRVVKGELQPSVIEKRHDLVPKSRFREVNQALEEF